MLPTAHHSLTVSSGPLLLLVSLLGVITCTVPFSDSNRFINWWLSFNLVWNSIKYKFRLRYYDDVCEWSICAYCDMVNCGDCAEISAWSSGCIRRRTALISRYSVPSAPTIWRENIMTMICCYKSTMSFFVRLSGRTFKQWNIYINLLCVVAYHSSLICVIFERFRDIGFLWTGQRWKSVAELHTIMHLVWK